MNKELEKVQPQPISKIIDAQKLIMTAIEKNLPVDTMERLLAMRRELQAEDSRDQFFRALSLFQSKCPIIPKDRTAGSGNFTYRYAPLDTIIKHIGPLLNDCGLSFSFDTEDSEKDKTTICTVHHIAGHSEKSRFKVPIDAAARMNDTQKQGSAGTYAKRYALCNALGILTGYEDDDGAAATPGAAGQQKTTQAPEPTEKPKDKTPEPKEGDTGMVTGLVRDCITNPTATKNGAHRSKIVLDNGNAYYTFDAKTVDLVKKEASNGPATIAWKKSKFGLDIQALYFQHAVDREKGNKPPIEEYKGELDPKAKG